MTSEKRLARIAGSLYLIVAVLGGFAELSVRSSIVAPGDAAATADNIRASATLFRLGFVSDLVLERYLESSRTTFSRFACHMFSGVGGRMSSQIAAKLPSSCGIRAGRAMNHQCRCSEPSPHRQT